jgi:hypothetical protein
MCGGGRTEYICDWTLFFWLYKNSEGVQTPNSIPHAQQVAHEGSSRSCLQFQPYPTHLNNWYALFYETEREKLYIHNFPFPRRKSRQTGETNFTSLMKKWFKLYNYI